MLIGAVRARVVRWATVVTGDVDDAEDVAQRVSLKLHDELGQFEAKSRFTTWLFRVVRNTAFDLRRSAWRRRSTQYDEDAMQQIVDSTGDAIERIDNENRAALIRSFFTELPPRQRQLIELVDQEGCTPTEAADVLGIEPETARVHLMRARRTLREKMMT